MTGKSAAQAIGDLAERAIGEHDGSLEPPAAAPYLLKFSRRAMACQFELFLNAGQYRHAQTVAVATLDLVDQLEEQLTVYRDTSEVMAINRQAFGRPVNTEPRLFALLDQAVRLSAATGGAFDITAGPLTKLWGFYRRQGSVPSEAALAETLPRIGSQHLRLDPAERTIAFALEGVELNLGAIGKGYALDRCGELLAEAAVHDYILHGGQSSVLARGSQATSAGGQTGWTVSVGDPLRPGKQLAELRLLDRALGTSGAGTQFFRQNGRRYGHIIDPRTGWPAEGMLSATVLAPTAAEADALATAFYILGAERSPEFCDSHPDIAAVLIRQVADADAEIQTANLGEDVLKLL